MTYLTYNRKRVSEAVYKLQNATLLIVLLHFILGIVFFDFIKTSILLVIFADLIFLKPRIMLLALTSLALGFILASYHSNNIRDEISSNYVTTTYSGFIVEPVEESLFGERLVADFKNLHSNVIIDHTGTNTFEYGDEISVDGEILVLGLNGQNDSYIEYLKSKNIHLEMKNPKIVLLSRNKNAISFLNSLKTYFTNIIDRGLNSPKSSLVNGILFGKKDNLSKEFKDQLKITGVTHIISASGFNVIVIYILTSSLDRFAGIKKARIISMFTIILYTFLIGIYNLPAQRAAIMLVYVLIAEQIGRQKHIEIALLLSIAIILVQYPFYWRNISMMLSIFATIGLFTLSKKFKLLIPSQTPEILSDIISTTLAATFATLPITIYSFGAIPLLALIANVIILPIVPILMYLGLLVIPIAILLPIAAKPIYILLNLATDFVLFFISLMAGKSEFYFDVSNHKIVILLLLVFTVIALDYNYFRKNNEI